MFFGGKDQLSSPLLYKFQTLNKRLKQILEV